MRLKRDTFIKILIVLLFSIIAIRLFYLQIINREYYLEELEKYTSKEIKVNTPRGRIYDKNYKLLVDNSLSLVIYYKKPNKIKPIDEVDLAYKVAKLISVDYSNLTTNNLKDFWLVTHRKEEQKLITDEEWLKYKERKLTNSDLYKLKLSRIDEKELSKYNELDKEAAYIYYLMNVGYKDDEKIIKNTDVTEEEFAIISEQNHLLNGFNTKYEWDRLYVYGDTFKTILGKVGPIPSEAKDYYLKKGYSLNDKVGISYLEYMYEDYLKGEKEIYLVNDSSTKLIKEGRRGNDLVLNIDISLQQEVDNILKEEVLNTKSEPNTSYYNRSFVVIADPNTGGILAMSGKQVIDSNGLKIVDYTPGVVTSPMTVGSVVKGASMLLGYITKSVSIGEYLMDECIKIKSTPIKCSHKNLGIINDIDAIAFSSNVYQFKIAIKIGKGIYKYDEALKIDNNAFQIYRDFYSQFGLGVKTNIDLPVESTGYKGSSMLPGLLLNFAIGQYDTYTPIQLSQYITTIARNGSRIKPVILKEIREPSNNQELGPIIYENKPLVLNTIDIKEEYMKRIKYALRQVLVYGTGRNHVNSSYNASGKTGTSESFLDSDNDGKIDTETLSTAFVGYMPSDNPIMTIVVTSPDSSYPSKFSKYQSNVNQRITRRVTDIFYKMYMS